MITSTLRIAAYRVVTTFRALRGGYLAVVLLLGLVGGVAMGAMAGARRTQSAFPAYVASTNPSDVQMFTEFDPITGTGYSAHVDRAIASLPHVRRSVDVIGFDGTVQELDTGQPGLVPGASVAPGAAPPSVEGSLNGEYFTQDRATLLRGRWWVPTRTDEVVMSSGAAADFGLRLGSTLPLAFFSDAQVNNPNFAGYPADRPAVIVRLKLVGLVEAAFQVVQDDDAALGDQFAVLSPSLTRRLATCCAYYSYVGLQVDATDHVSTVVASAQRLLPNLGQAGGSRTDAPTIAKAERVVRPESIAWGVFGVIAALAALIVVSQAVSRIVRRGADDRGVLRAVGAGPALTMLDALLGPLLAVAVGALVAVGVAVALSPLAPTGSVRAVYPGGGVAFDWTVLGSGCVILVVGIDVLSVLAAWRASLHRAARRALEPSRDSGAGRLGGTGLPLVGLLGVRAALGFGSDRTEAPVRSALLGTVLAVVLVVTSVVFGSSINALVSRPALYGWNWDYALLSGFSGAEDLPAAQTAQLLRHDPNVARFAPVSFVHLSIDGRNEAALATRPGAPVHPPVLSGHALGTARDVVLGPATMNALHKHLGQTVSVSAGGPGRAGRPVTLRIVGTATLPTIGGSGSPDLQMGAGAVVPVDIVPPAALNPQGSAVPGPNAELIDIKANVPRAWALASLNHLTAILNGPSDADGPVGGIVANLRPAEIANNRAVGSLPFALAGVVAGSAILALGLTLVASVRRRRHEFALLKAVGLSQRQIASTVAWQATVSAVLGCVVGLPVGIVVGRALWSAFARDIYAVPHPDVPAISMAAVAVGALVFVNAVAAVPARLAARTPTARLFAEH
jgi:hypothetical protein